jgi:hypothetical protein
VKLVFPQKGKNVDKLSEGRVLRRIFVPKRNEVIRGSGKLLELG